MLQPQEQEEGVGELLGRLVEDGKTFARAEVRYYRTLAMGKLAEAKTGVVFELGALVIALSALTALLVGLILTLATLVGPGFATLIVIVVALVLAGLLGWLGYRHFARMMGPSA